MRNLYLFALSICCSIALLSVAPSVFSHTSHQPPRQLTPGLPDSSKDGCIYFPGIIDYLGHHTPSGAAFACVSNNNCNELTSNRLLILRQLALQAQQLAVRADNFLASADNGSGNILVPQHIAAEIITLANIITVNTTFRGDISQQLEQLGVGQTVINRLLRLHFLLIADNPNTEQQRLLTILLERLGHTQGGHHLNAEDLYNALYRINNLDLGSLYLQDITAIAGLVWLTHLNLNDNNIADIQPLVGLTQLTTLSLGYNNIQNITPLSRMIRLTNLSLTANRIRSIVAIRHLLGLSVLWLNTNLINNISPLAQLSQLSTLSIEHNNIATLAPLTPLIGLNRLYAGTNQITDIGSLVGLSQLTYLSLINNQISDISGLAQLTNLNDLYLNQNHVHSLLPIAGLNQLTALSISDNQITSIIPIAGLTNLTELYIENNHVSDFTPLNHLPQLATLYLEHNPITSNIINELSAIIPQLTDNDVQEAADSISQQHAGHHTVGRRLFTPFIRLHLTVPTHSAMYEKWTPLSPYSPTQLLRRSSATLAAAKTTASIASTPDHCKDAMVQLTISPEYDNQVASYLSHGGSFNLSGNVYPKDIIELPLQPYDSSSIQQGCYLIVGGNDSICRTYGKDAAYYDHATEKFLPTKIIVPLATVKRAVLPNFISLSLLPNPPQVPPEHTTIPAWYKQYGTEGKCTGQCHSTIGEGLRRLMSIDSKSPYKSGIINHPNTSEYFSAHNSNGQLHPTYDPSYDDIRRATWLTVPVMNVATQHMTKVNLRGYRKEMCNHRQVGMNVSLTQSCTKGSQLEFYYNTADNTHLEEGYYKSIEPIIIRAHAAGKSNSPLTNVIPSLHYDLNIHHENNVLQRIDAVISQRLNVRGNTGDVNIIGFEIPHGANNLQVLMQSNTGYTDEEDADLYVRYTREPNFYHYGCRPYLYGSNEECHFSQPKAGTYYVMLHAYKRFTDISFRASYITPHDHPIVNNITKRGTGHATGQFAELGWLHYRVEIPTGVSQLKVTMTSKTGDPDLYLSQNQLPTKYHYQCRPYFGGQQTEVCTIDYPAAGTWYIGLHAYQGFTDAELIVHYKP